MGRSRCEQAELFVRLIHILVANYYQMKTIRCASISAEMKGNSPPFRVQRDYGKAATKSRSTESEKETKHGGNCSAYCFKQIIKIDFEASN